MAEITIPKEKLTDKPQVWPEDIEFEVVVCQDEKGGIAKDGLIPWDIPADRKKFAEITTRANPRRAKTITTGNIVIMGRKTMESIPIKNRFWTNEARLFIILTSDVKNLGDYAVLIKTGRIRPALSWKEISTLLNWMAWQEDGQFFQVFVMGGGKVYNAAFRNEIPGMTMTNLHVSTVYKDYECDTKIVYSNQAYMLDLFELEPHDTPERWEYAHYITAKCQAPVTPKSEK